MSPWEYYAATTTDKNGVMQAQSGTWSFVSGTGKMKGIKGTGACKHTPESGGYLDYACSGEYTLHGTAASKP